MSGVNKVILIGNLGKDPEVKHLESGATVANFPLATTESYKNKNGEKVDQTEWHNIALWRGLAEVAEKYLNKGKQIYLEGRIRTRSYEDKEGNKKYFTEIIGNNMTMLGGGRSSESKQESTTAPENEVGPPQEEDDLPF